MAASTARSRKGSTRAERRASGESPPRLTAAEVVRWLERRGSQKQIQELERYGIAATKPFGVAMGELKKYAKQVGTDHELAQKLWATGRYEARLLASLIDDPERVTAAQMRAWAADFDNWAIVDTVCFHLFDRSAHAWKQLPRWAKARGEFTRRTAFALLWSLSVHDKTASDDAFLACLPLIEAAAEDERDFVKKGVNMALRAVGKRNRALNAAAIETAERLAASDTASARWVGSHALRELRSPAVRRRLASKRR